MGAALQQSVYKCPVWVHPVTACMIMRTCSGCLNMKSCFTSTRANHQLTTTNAVQGFKIFKHAPHTLSLTSSRSRSVSPICMYLSLDVLMVARSFSASYGALFHGLHHCLASAILDHARELNLQQMPTPCSTAC